MTTKQIHCPDCGLTATPSRQEPWRYWRDHCARHFVPNTRKPSSESNTLAWLLTNTLANVDRGS